QFANGRTVFHELKLERPAALIHSEPECAGLAVYATDASAREKWRNLAGSEMLNFEFRFLATGGKSEAIACDLPIAQHRQEPQMLVSHTTGKRSHTDFKSLENFGRFALWQACSRYPRPHQVRLHAMECGLHLPGEPLYIHEAGASPPLPRLPLLWLEAVELPGEPTQRFVWPETKTKKTLMRTLERFKTQPSPSSLRQ
ncbi:MAG: hypothetical protein ACOCVG_02470, partial [Verrucomicrobiota bacterium]